MLESLSWRLMLPVMRTREQARDYMASANEGVTALEYSIMGGLLILGAAVAMTALNTQVVALFGRITARVQAIV